VSGTIEFEPNGDIRNAAVTLYTYKGNKKSKLAVVR
jgi:branched-chain amino acid transport system substrate-binding protein